MRRSSAPANPDDGATNLAAELLVEPLYRHVTTAQPGWEVTATVRSDATKAQFSHLLGGEDTPALLFTASHGMEFPLGHPHQMPHQGALLCQDWPRSPQSLAKIGGDSHRFLLLRR